MGAPGASCGLHAPSRFCEARPSGCTRGRWRTSAYQMVFLGVKAIAKNRALQGFQEYPSAVPCGPSGRRPAAREPPVAVESDAKCRSQQRFGTPTTLRRETRMRITRPTQAILPGGTNDATSVLRPAPPNRVGGGTPDEPAALRRPQGNEQESPADVLLHDQLPAL